MRVENARQLRLREDQVAGKGHARGRRVDAQFLRTAIVQNLAERLDHRDRVRIFEPAHRARDVRITLARRGHDESLNPGALAIDHQPL